MGPVAPAGVANPVCRVPAVGRIGDLQLPSCCSGKALCIKGSAVWQVAWYQRSAERLDNWSAMNAQTMSMPPKGFSKKPDRPGRYPRPLSLQTLAAKLGAQRLYTRSRGDAAATTVLIAPASHG